MRADDPVCSECGKRDERGLSAFPDVGLVCPDCGVKLYALLKPAQQVQHPEFRGK
jgi:DNA-directed RNA polymerase subunit RPC12/RpoP